MGVVLLGAVEASHLREVVVVADCQTVGMVAWPRKALRCLSKASDKSLIVFLGLPPMFFNVHLRVPCI